MKVRHHKPSGKIVIISTTVTVLLGFFILLLEISELQVQKQDGFERMFKNQSVRRVRIPAVRGKIFDTQNRCLADSVPNYCIAIYTHELRSPRSAIANSLELIHEIWSRIGINPNIDYINLKRHLSLTPNKPFQVYHDLNDEQIIHWRQQFEKWTAPPKNSFRRQRIPGLKLSYPVEDRSIFIQTSELLSKRTSTAANTLELIYEISSRTNLKRTTTLQEIKNHIYARRPLPLIAWNNLKMDSILQWADSCSSLRGTDIICYPDRNYTDGKHIAHLLGYTLKIQNIEDFSDIGKIHYDVSGLSGEKGLEGIYNDILSGTPGYQILQVDAAGFHNRELQITKPIAGGDIKLTIDSEIQKICNDALNFQQPGEKNKIVKGAVVILDPNNGDVLALASSPTFDPNKYMKSSKYRQEMMVDPHSSTFQRAVFGQYPPGSTFKTITSLAALKEDEGFYDYQYNCLMGYKVSGRIMRCWIHSQGATHGLLNLENALMRSCNIYMYETAQKIGYEPIYSMARQFGIGQYAGLFPKLNEQYIHKKLKYGNLPESANNAIDLCNLSIGQGQILTSPLQMAMVTAAIANDGKLFRPRLIKEFRNLPNEKFIKNPTYLIRDIDIDLKSLELVKSAMKKVVMNQNGTATRANIKKIEIAGKTGSAQYKKKIDDKITNHVYAWMISFAPYENPKYAIAMIIEDGVSGGQTVAPRLSKLYKDLFKYDGSLGGRK